MTNVIIHSASNSERTPDSVCCCVFDPANWLHKREKGIPLDDYVRAMGSYLSATPKREEDSDFDTSDENASSDMENEHDDMATDAVELGTQTRNLSIDPITEVEIVVIGKHLDVNEKVSLIYLLYDSAHLALQCIKLVLEDEHYEFLTEWVNHKQSSSCSKWQTKLLEALTIIQNYQILRKLGFTKDEMNKRFLPLVKTTSLYVSPIRKCLYRICEDFTVEDTETFLSHIEGDVKIVPGYSDYAVNYLEIYLLHFETKKYISCSNKNNADLANIIKVCKYMELDELENELKSLSPTKIDETKEIRKPNVSEQYETASSPSESSGESFGLEEFLNTDKPPGKSQMNEQKNKKKKKKKKIRSRKVDCSQEVTNDLGDNKYHIDPLNPGILVIINNKYFYSEFNKDLSPLLPSPHQLQQREGTDADRDTLNTTFTQFGFKVICLENLTHEQILSEIKKVVNKIDKESCLFIAILSHGILGGVYGSNSISVKVTDIQNIMCRKALVGRPKVLILQSCQGSECQNLNESDELTTDGPSNVLAVPTTADMLIFWATVPGYGAVRHKTDGTWFIQSLCKEMREKQNLHFLDICVFVKREVIDKRWKQRAMVPLVESTFAKFLYLPKLKSITVL